MSSVFTNLRADVSVCRTPRPHRCLNFRHPARITVNTRQTTCHAGVASADATDDAEIPESLEQSISQAEEAISSALSVDKKRQKKGFALWPGVKRLAVEIPVQDETPAAQLDLVQSLLSSLPRSAGLPVVVFGDQATTDYARDQNIPNEVYSVDECAHEDDMEGPLVLACTSRDQGSACDHVVNDKWRGKAVLVVNAGWYREIPLGLDEFADSFVCVYYFLPISFQGIFGGQTGFVFKWSQSQSNKNLWQIFLDDKGIQRVGQMATKPSESDMEAAVYNAAAAKSPLTAGAKLFNKMTKGLRGEGKKK